MEGEPGIGGSWQLCCFSSFFGALQNVGVGEDVSAEAVVHSCLLILDRLTRTCVGDVSHVNLEVVVSESGT